jgi:hypothetical protein
MDEFIICMDEFTISMNEFMVCMDEFIVGMDEFTKKFNDKQYNITIGNFPYSFFGWPWGGGAYDGILIPKE